MRVLRDYSQVPRECTGAAVAVGHFDGVHRGHQTLLARTAEAAAAERSPFSVLTFEPHARQVFQPDTPPFRLTPFRNKLRVLDRLGVESVFCLRFNEALYQKPAERFVEDVLVAGMAVRHVVVGYNFVFGYRRSGNAETLQRLGQQHGFAVTVVAPVTHDSDVCSSTIIRVNLEAGRARRAAELLGHWWEVEGRVRRGDRRGRQLGFPTLNVHMDPNSLRPALGVYAVRVALEEAGRRVWRDGVANLGRRPTFDGRGVILEVHLFDYAADLYGRIVRVAFVDWLRPEQRFPGLEALKAQIAEDGRQARARLALPENARERLLLRPLHPQGAAPAG